MFPVAKKQMSAIAEFPPAAQQPVVRGRWPAGRVKTIPSGAADDDLLRENDVKRVFIDGRPQPVTAQVPDDTVVPAAAEDTRRVVPYRFVSEEPQMISMGSHVNLPETLELTPV